MRKGSKGGVPILVPIWAVMLAAAPGHTAQVQSDVRVEQGLLAARAPDAHGVRAYLGIPYAAPPTGEWRWRPPRPPVAWDGVRAADRFGDRCVQTNPFDDMLFQSAGESEDCLTLSIWTGGEPGEARPVMVWIHGGGHFSGASDERRHDGTALARRGVVLVAINYRLGVLGFFAHPELSAESPEGASGNYGLLDQIAALRWVRDNIAAFGGDPGNVTIFGESAGSWSVSALMASPPASGLFHKAIGQSGAFMFATDAETRAAAEGRGEAFAAEVGAGGLADLRAVPAERLVEAVGRRTYLFEAIVDGHVLPEPARAIFARGEQAPVPLVVGWTSAEVPLGPSAGAYLDTMLGEAFPPESRAAAAVHYPGGTAEERWRSAVTLASDRWMVRETWTWAELHARAGFPTYRYLFDQPRPSADGPPAPDVPGAAHAQDIEFTFGTLASLPLAWSEADREVSHLMGTLWTSFARTGVPAAESMPRWPAWISGGGGRFLRIAAPPVVEIERDDARLRFLEASSR
jgi:para-nitrobenzyl esterase